MYMKRISRALVLGGTVAIAYVTCAVACSDSSNSRLTELSRRSDQAIIGGTTPTRGSEQWRGVVYITRPDGAGTGTLLTNRHVLTARHVVAEWLDPGWRAAYPANTFSIRLDGASWSLDQTVTAAKIYEPDTTQGLGASDYAIIELSTPMSFAGVTNGFANKMSTYSDGALVGKQGFCLGYGINREAVVWNPLTGKGELASGSGTLRSATFTLSSGTAGTFKIYRQTNASGYSIIPGPGDSGGTCFVEGAVTGVASLCNPDTAEIDGTGGITSAEWTKIKDCTYASPDSLYNWANPIYRAGVSFGYDYVPALASGTVTADLYVPNDSFKGSIISPAAPQSLASFAPRSGFIRVVPTNEPANMMCPILESTAPMSGAASLRGTCLSDGILPVLNSTVLL